MGCKVLTYRVCLRLVPHPERHSYSFSRTVNDVRELVMSAASTAMGSLELYADRAGWLVVGGYGVLITARITIPETSPGPGGPGIGRGLAVEICASASGESGPTVLVGIVRAIAEGARGKGYGVLLES